MQTKALTKTCYILLQRMKLRNFKSVNGWLYQKEPRTPTHQVSPSLCLTQGLWTCDLVVGTIYTIRKTPTITSITKSSLSCPYLSVIDVLRIGFTAPHGVVASGSMLMAIIWIAAVAAVVAAVGR
jgi:hypothetical protein